MLCRLASRCRSFACCWQGRAGSGKRAANVRRLPRRRRDWFDLTDVGRSLARLIFASGLALPLLLAIPASAQTTISSPQEPAARGEPPVDPSRGAAPQSKATPPAGEGQPSEKSSPGATPPEQVRPREGTPILTLSDLEQMALANNPSLARAAALVEAARGNWVQVGLPPNFAWGYLGQQLGSGNVASQHALLVDGELVTAGKLRWNRAIAEQEIARAEQQFFAQQQRVLTDVRIAFYEALLAQRGLDLARQLVAIAQQAQQAAERLHRAGETTRVDLYQAQIEVASAQNDLQNATARHFAAWQSLRAVLGVPQLPPAVLQGDLEAIPPEPSWEEVLQRLWTTSPEVSAAVANLQRAEAALVRARREPIPNIRLQMGVMQDMGYGGKTDGIVQTLLPLPLVNRNQGAIRQAEAELAAAEQALRQVELDLQNRLAPVYERYTAAARRVQRYREVILPAAQEALSLVRQGYSAGEFPFLSLLNAQRTYFQHSQQYLQSLLELRTASAEIEGLLLRGSLSGQP
jgi:cobalt-zinc-cadmium efflux system outer membrane protein